MSLIADVISFLFCFLISVGIGAKPEVAPHRRFNWFIGNSVKNF